jgi:hypothetical protein
VNEATKRLRQTRFTALLHDFDFVALARAYRRLRRQAAPGADGVAHSLALSSFLRLDLLHRRRDKQGKNALFASSDGRTQHCVITASLIETCKLNAVDPLANLAESS